jgi:hypothetical protein
LVLHFLDERYAVSTPAAVCLNEGRIFALSAIFWKRLYVVLIQSTQLHFKFYALMLFRATVILVNELLSGKNKLVWRFLQLFGAIFAISIFCINSFFNFLGFFP